MKRALVLGHGGARGAFQVGAEKYARVARGYTWDIIAGISIGAINGAMIASGKQDRLIQLWQESGLGFRRRKLSMLADIAAGVINRRSALLSNPEMESLISSEIELAQTSPELRVGAVSLSSGKYESFSSKDPALTEVEFKNALRASIAMPIALSPVDVGRTATAMVDGGLRRAIPVADLDDQELDEIVLVTGDKVSVSEGFKPNSTKAVAYRALEIILNELLQRDLQSFDDLQRATGKRSRLVLIQPDEPLDAFSDFSSRAISRSFVAGWYAAERAFAVLPDVVGTGIVDAAF